VNVQETIRYRLEVVEILAHYEAIRRPLALRFLAAVEEAHGRAVASPLAHRERKDGVRVILLRRFPYLLRFQLSENQRTLRILSLTHAARKPE
jgi:hypothetical protein